MDTGLTTISEADIDKHRATAQSMITRIVVMEDSSGRSGAEIAGTGRRFVSTVSTGSVRRTREVELGKTVAAIRPDDQLMSIPQHTLLYRTRRGISIALAVAAVCAEGSDLESLQARNARAVDRASALHGGRRICSIGKGRERRGCDGGAEGA